MENHEHKVFVEQLYTPEDGLCGSMKNRTSVHAMKQGISVDQVNDACLLPIAVYNRLGTIKSTVHNWVVGPLEIDELVVMDGLALPDQASLISDVNVEANVIIDKAMGISDCICCLTS